MPCIKAECTQDSCDVKEMACYVDELKPCPFCGHTELVVKEKTDTPLGELYYVFCYHCEATSGKYMTGSLAKYNWNKRMITTKQSKGEQLWKVIYLDSTS